MDFVVRNAGDRDWDQCSRLLAGRFLYAEPELRGLHDLWSHVAASKSGLISVVADARNPFHVWLFACLLFIPDEQADRYHRLISPGIGRDIARQWLDGRRPFLTRHEIARFNAGSGLNVLASHHGVSEPAEIASRERLRSMSYKLALATFRGWNLRTYTNEVFADNPKRDGEEMGRALGFRLAQYTRQQLAAAGIPEDKAPWVWTATRADADSYPAAIAPSILFRSFSQPRFGFNFFEQDLLTLALDGHTDASIASSMKLSVATIKRHLREIYSKVDWANAEELLRPPAEGVRGPELRRHLLRYLADHPEELRPCAPAKIRLH